MQVFFILFSVHFAVYQYINSKCLYRTHVNVRFHSLSTQKVYTNLHLLIGMLILIDGGDNALKEVGIAVHSFLNVSIVKCFEM